MKLQTGKIQATFLAIMLTGLLATGLMATALAGVKAQLERNTVYEGDTVTLIIESDGQQSGQLDLAVLNSDFKVLGSSTSTQVTIINGRRSDKTSWTVQLEPRHKGTLQIPPISVGSEQTQALELKVTDIPEHVASEQSTHVFLEVEADNNGHGLYVQQQLSYTVRLYYDENILKGELEAPRPEQAVVEQLGEDKRYTTLRNARRYNVIERHYAISPEKSGLLIIPPAMFKGQIASTQKAPGQRLPRNRLMDRFFAESPFSNDSFFSSTPFADPGQPVRIHSKAIRIEVLPRPVSAANPWLPAEQLVLQDSWAEKPPQFRAGEPVSRTITLQAKGLTGSQLPVLELEQPEQTRIYPETPVNESRTDGHKVYGISKQNFTYIPGKSGKLIIPAFELSWWNTRSNQQATARLPQWELSVEPGIVDTQTRPAPAPNNRMQPAATQISVPETQTQAPTRLEQLTSFKHWPAVAAALLLIIFALLLAKRIRQRKSASPGTKAGPAAELDYRTRIRTLLPQLERACTANDAKAAAHALLELGHAQWPDDPPRNLGRLATLLSEGVEQIMALDRALYATDTAQWNGSSLWDSVKDAWHKPPTEKHSNKESLRPLYPQNV